MSRVNLSKDGSTIDFKTSDTVPTTAKKFRQSPEIQGFYSFIYDNGLRIEAFEILTKILIRRRAEKKAKMAQKKSGKKAKKK